MTREQEIINLRFAAMRTKLDSFEDDAIKIMLKNYEQAKNELLQELRVFEARGLSFSVERAKSLLTEVETAIVVIKEKMTGDIIEMSTYAGLFSYPEINKITSWDGRIEGFDNVSLSAGQLTAAIVTTPLGGRVLSDWVNRTFSNITDEIKEQLDIGLVKGESYRKLTNRLTQNFNILKREAETLAKSYVQDVNVSAALDVFEANDDVIKGVEWTAIMENGNVRTGRGTCPRCQALDGLQWAVKDRSRPYCPLHAKCRCMFVPVTLSWRELGFDVDEMEDIYQPWTTRAININGRPIIDYGFTQMDYPSFWKTKSKKWQNNAIGPRRAEMIRNGEIEFRDIVDQKTGRLYTIKELNARK